MRTVARRLRIAKISRRVFATDAVDANSGLRSQRRPISCVNKSQSLCAQLTETSNASRLSLKALFLRFHSHLKPNYQKGNWYPAVDLRSRKKKQKHRRVSLKKNCIEMSLIRDERTKTMMDGFQYLMKQPHWNCTVDDWKHHSVAVDWWRRGGCRRWRRRRRRWRNRRGRRRWRFQASSNDIRSPIDFSDRVA